MSVSATSSRASWTHRRPASITSSGSHSLAARSHTWTAWEGLLAQVLKDDRLAMHLPQIAVGIDQVMTVPTAILEVVARFCELIPAVLRDEAMKVVCAQAGYAPAKLWELRGMPWLLVLRDTNQKLEALWASDGVPADEVSQRI